MTIGLHFAGYVVYIWNFRIIRRYGMGRAKKALGSDAPLWYSLIAFDALVSPLEREESGREVTLAAFFYVRPKTARLCEGLGNSTK
jgi:hypothetical protein